MKKAITLILSCLMFFSPQLAYAKNNSASDFPSAIESGIHKVGNELEE